MRRLLRISAVAILALAGASFSAGQALGQPLCRDFGMGNGGFDAGYSMAISRCATRGWSVGGGWGSRCGSLPVMPSCWRPCGWPGGWWGGWCGGYGWSHGCRPRFCGGPGFWFGSPCFGVGGWAGSSSFFGSQSVYLATPAGGGATFFSGAVVPYVVPYAVPYPVPGPWWFGAQRNPVAGAAAFAAAQPAASRPAIANPPVVRAVAVGPRPSASLGRRRAQELVTKGDQLLRAAAADPVRLRAAADAYRRAAAAAADDPDIHVRHALALVALGRDQEADRVLRKAAAIDGRLVDRPGARRAGEPAPLIARGAALLHSIAGVEDGPLPQPLADLEAAWSGVDAGPRLRLAANEAGRAP